MKTLKLMTMAAMASLTLALTNCETERLQTETGSQQQVIPSTHLKKLKDLGYDTNAISIDTDRSAYIIEDEMVLNVSDVEAMVSEKTANKQRRTKNLVGC